jgi:hypothetical protein
MEEVVARLRAAGDGMKSALLKHALAFSRRRARN